MKYQRIKVKELKDWDECYGAVQDIENDPDNVLGGMKAWMSGNPTSLKKGAVQKIAAVERRMEAFEELEVECEIEADS